MKTIEEVFKIYRQALQIVHDTLETEALTLLTVTEITGLSKASVKAFPEKELSAKQSEKLTNTLARLKTGEPLQYILGYTEFYGLKFLVNSSVLIPRPETEELVEWILQSAQLDTTILDIGTGSGCIAISLKKNLPGAQVSAMDISTKALETAKTNAKLNNTEVNFIKTDILQSANSMASMPYNIIVSNPPYVTLLDKERMHSNVTDFEPHTALFVPENDPLLFYRVIAEYALNNLTANGLLFFEINESYGQETVDLLSEKGLINIQLRKDMSGRDRMICAQKP